MNFFTKLFKKKQNVREAIDNVELGGEKSKKALKDAEDEYEKIKKNKGKILKNPLVPEVHLQELSWTVATWLLVKEDAEKKMVSPKNVVKVIRLFLEQEKKGEFIEDFNRSDARILFTSTYLIETKTVEELLKKNNYQWTYEAGKDFEKSIGYKD